MKKILITSSILLLVAVVLCLSVFATAPEEVTTILACSDFQASSGNASGKQQVSAILSAMAKDDITSADGFFVCGDYDYEYTDTKGGITALKQAVSGVVTENMVFVQGNHDSAIGSDGLSPSGNNDPSHGKYGVFVINEDDYMWYNDNEQTIKRTAQLLIEYLNEKIAEGYNKPIFILSHLPLNYNMRTVNDGDMKHARYLVDALNEAGTRGLNLFYLFGHDHSNGWDDYLGGSSIYLKKGDTMLVSNGRGLYRETEIAFTYFNAGYTGYYENHNGADDALTMTYITIRGGEVSISRYDKNGLHNMKSEGVTNAYKNERPYAPNTTVYTSPQTVSLTSVSDKTPIDDLLPVDKTSLRYRKVESLDEIKDDGRYLLVYNSSTDYFMIPQVVTKANDSGSQRRGFDIVETDLFGGSIVYGDFADKEWTLMKTEGGWLVMSDDKYATFTSTSEYSVTATLEDEPAVFTLEDLGDLFSFKSGGYYFNYNARGLINGFASNPASFYLYEATGYGVEVSGGVADKTSASAGETVTLTATIPEGKVFEAWTVLQGTLTLEDTTSATVSFTMPESGVVLRATFKDAPLPPQTTAVTTQPKVPESTPMTAPDTTPITTPDTTPNTEEEQAPAEIGGLQWTVYITIGVGIAFALTLAVIVIVNKKKES